jgi:uncharacterized BrkB/YihY/UPF0761 family membrane protein
MSALRSLARFVGELVRAQHRDRLLVRAGALAYTTLLSLVPLLTVGLVTVSQLQPERAAVMVQAIATVLPFSPERVQATLGEVRARTGTGGNGERDSLTLAALAKQVNGEQATAPEGPANGASETP